jgi:hypothetical protein
MPTRAEIEQQVHKATAQDLVRRGFLAKLHRHTKRDTLLYASGFSTTKEVVVQGSLLSIGLMDIQGFMAALKGLKGKELDLILHSPGGSLDAADQIVQYLRSKYDHIRAFIPQNAMSAATMVACACDEIWMGKQSALGPIDPQMVLPTGGGVRSIPAQAILDEFEDIKKEVLEKPALAAIYYDRIRGYPYGFMKLCRTAIEHSQTRVAEWLAKYMFKNQPDAAKKAADTADWLANEYASHGRPLGHGSHSRPLGLEIIAAETELVIKRLEEDQKLQDLVLSTYHATTLTFDTTPCFKMIENHLGKGVYFQAAQQQVAVAAPFPMPFIPGRPAAQPIRPQQPQVPRTQQPAAPSPQNPDKTEQK